jgi:glycerol kinase
LARAALQSICYQVRDVVDVFCAATSSNITKVLADGGAMRSDLLAQAQADLLRMPVWRSRSESLAALGAAYLAGLATGIWRSVDEIRQLPRSFAEFPPSANAESMQSSYQGWREALGRASNDHLRPVSSGAEV